MTIVNLSKMYPSMNIHKNESWLSVILIVLLFKTGCGLLGGVGGVGDENGVLLIITWGCEGEAEEGGNDRTGLVSRVFSCPFKSIECSSNRNTRIVTATVRLHLIKIWKKCFSNLERLLRVLAYI